MAWNWLMGRPVVEVGWGGGLNFGSSFTITISHVQEIVERLKQEGATEVSVRMLQRGIAPAPWMDVTQYEVELTPNSSDDHLSAISIQAGWPQSDTSIMSAAINLGSRVPASIFISDLNTNMGSAEHVARRVADVITSSRRQIPPWKWLQILRFLGGVLLAALGAWAAFALRDTPPAALVAVVAVSAFALEVSPRITKLVDGKPASVKQGVVSIDATPLEKVRADRRQRRTNWRVASASILGTLVAAALTAWLTGLWTPGSK